MTDAAMLDAHVGQNVIVVGKVMQLRGESAIVDAGGQINAILNPVSRIRPAAVLHSLVLPR